MQRIGRMACRMGSRNRDSNSQGEFFIRFERCFVLRSLASTRGRSYRSYISMAWERKSDERGLNKSVSISVSLRALDLDLLAILMHHRRWCPMEHRWHVIRCVRLDLEILEIFNHLHGRRTMHHSRHTQKGPHTSTDGRIALQPAFYR